MGLGCGLVSIDTDVEGDGYVMYRCRLKGQKALKVDIEVQGVCTI